MLDGALSHLIAMAAPRASQAPRWPGVQVLRFTGPRPRGPSGALGAFGATLRYACVAGACLRKKENT